MSGVLDAGFTVQAVEEAEPSEEMMGIPGMADEMRRPMMLMIKAKKSGERAADGIRQNKIFGDGALIEQKDYVMRIVHEWVRTLIKLIFNQDIDKDDDDGISLEVMETVQEAALYDRRREDQ